VPLRSSDSKSSLAHYEETLAFHGSEPVFNEDGVDLTQVRVALERTPLERLLHHEASANSVRWLLAVAVPVRPPDAGPL
jgi:hypothetical protein